ncbi:MAG TPA: hypothetical protein VLL52_11350 [Anaerolineae bacterium]|nr:hypothetical protein [Anaerolineae bacterium]
MTIQKQLLYLALTLTLLFLTACQASNNPPLPTLMAAAFPPTYTPSPSATHPPTWTPAPLDIDNRPAPQNRVAFSTPTLIATIPTRTPFPPTPTPTHTPSPTSNVSPTPTSKPLALYAAHEPLPYDVYPRPANDNGWGIHWIPTVSQERHIIDQYVREAARMHIKWVVFLHEGAPNESNDYLVAQLNAHGIMPVMRLYRAGVLPYDGDIGRTVAHYRRRGVYYFQLYNEPNANEENHQGFSNPNQYATAWAGAARQVVANGGYPGFGALSPNGAYNHYTFLDRSLRAIIRNGDQHLLNRAWLSVHNYHGTRAYDDPNGFLMIRRYDEIVRDNLDGRSLPMIGTEAGSYHPDPHVEKQFLTVQYNYMRDAEPYYLAFSWWLIANRAGGGFDDRWEYQSLFRPGFTHPAVTDYFYVHSR